jgi:hypothetical protein
LRRHGLKAQVVYLPIEIIGLVCVTELRQIDNGIQNISGLNNYLLELLSGAFIGGLFPCLIVLGSFSCELNPVEMCMLLISRQMPRFF